MDYMSRRLIPPHFQIGFIKLLSPLVQIFSKWGLSPNSFTIAGVIVTFLGAVAFLTGFIRWAGILILLGGFCDTVDGLLARTTGKATRFGALLDSTADRYSEFVMFFGIIAYFFYIDDYSTAAGAFVALCGSFMVSYSRARAESLGLDARVGIMQRPERIVMIALGAVIHINAFKCAIWLVAVLANFTTLQRIRSACKQDSTEPKEEVSIKI